MMRATIPMCDHNDELVVKEYSCLSAYLTDLKEYATDSITVECLEWARVCAAELEQALQQAIRLLNLYAEGTYDVEMLYELVQKKQACEEAADED